MLALRHLKIRLFPLPRHLSRCFFFFFLRYVRIRVFRKLTLADFLSTTKDILGARFPEQTHRRVKSLKPLLSTYFHGEKI